LLAPMPMLSFDDSIGSTDDLDATEGSMSLNEMTSNLQQFKRQFSTLKTKWSRAFTEVEAGYSLVFQDLERLQYLAAQQVRLLGSPSVLDGCGSTPPPVWEGLSSAHIMLTEVNFTIDAHAASLNEISTTQDCLVLNVSSLKTSGEDAMEDMNQKVRLVKSDLPFLKLKFSNWFLYSLN
jgi:CDP-diacylglycerol pyrophosphatase